MITKTVSTGWVFTVRSVDLTTHLVTQIQSASLTSTGIPTTGGASVDLTSPTRPDSSPAPGQTSISAGTSVAASSGTVNGANGAAMINVTDINVPTAGLALTFERHYDSTATGSGGTNDLNMGAGWYGSYFDLIDSGAKLLYFLDQQRWCGVTVQAFNK